MNQFQKGDILQGSDRSYDAAKHYIVFDRPFGGDDFIGGMITHMQSDKNIQMQETHFEEIDKGGDKYEVQFDNTLLVKAKLRKFIIWGPFTLVGKLTPDGVAFFDKTTGNLNVETWDEYKIRTENT
jgi:hypothetical protein